MKLLVASGVLVALQFTLLSRAMCQDNNKADQRLHVMATGPPGRVTLEAERIERGLSCPSVIQLKGNVEIKVTTVVQDRPLSLMIMVVRADEADYHEETGEIEARGHVSLNYRDDPAKPKAAGNVRIKLEAAR